MDHWIERAQSAEAKIKTMEDAYKPALERIKEFKANFGIREKQGGEIEIDFEKFAQNIGIEGAMELRQIIDETYNISGDPGAKPKIKLSA